MMNYYLPLKGMASMHCSANTDMNGENTAIFFGLSGTGKTTLSTDPKRLLIGDDEHGWDDNGVFNFEGGCYAKVINLDKDSEPDIYNAIKRNALLENVTLDENGKIDFADKSVTENTRVSYPIDHIKNIVRPISCLLYTSGELCARYYVTVVSDEIHCDLTDPGKEYIPFASVSDVCRDISITCVAPTKTFNIAGLQTAAVIVPHKNLRHKVWKMCIRDSYITMLF